MTIGENLGISIDELLCKDDKNEAKINSNFLDTVCGALCYAMGVTPPKHAAEKNSELANYIDKIFDALIRAGKKIALITYGKCSLSIIFLERKIDYYHGN